MTDAEIEEYFERHKVRDAAQAAIRETRDKPARLIGTRARKNVCTSFASRKMGCTIQAESRTAEYAFALEFEYEANVLEYWDQVSSISINRTYKNGRKHRDPYKSDFLVLLDSGPEVYEVKPEYELALLCERYPTDWKMTESGFIYIPAFEAFSGIGLPHYVKSTAELNSIRTANLRILLQSRRVESQVTSGLRKKIAKIFSDQIWISLSDLADASALTDLTPILQLIDAGCLHACLEEELLSLPDSTYITSSSKMLEHYLAFKDANSGNEYLSKDEIESSIKLVPSEKMADRALEILRRIASGEKSRSVYRWLKKIEDGKRNGLSQLQALLPNYHLSGNRTQRINIQCVEFLNEFIVNEYASHKRMPPHAAYRRYRSLARCHHPRHAEVSWPTFRSCLLKSNKRDMAEARGGLRAANAQEEPVPVKDRELRTTLPFELATMDHYKADIMCVVIDANGRQYKLRPWISALVDLHTGAVLAIWLSFREPSVRSCAMVIRQCVRRYGKLPAGIIVDRGSDFQSVFFHALLAHCEVDLVLRPTAHPRFGSEVERFFGILKTMLFSFMPGNLASYRESRSVSSTHSPANTASLTIEQLLIELFKFVDWKNSTVSGQTLTTPAEIVKSGLKKYPCMGREVVYDDNFIISSAVDTKTYKVDPVRGIHTGAGYHYWNPDLKELAECRRPAQVRLEPENPYRLYAFLKDRWVTCAASPNKVFQHNDPVSRLAEAIRISDGREALEAAKRDSDYDLVKLLDASPSTLPASPDSTNQISIKSKDDVNAEWGNYITLDPLAISEWDDEK